MGNVASLRRNIRIVQVSRWQWVNAVAACRLDTLRSLKGAVSACWMGVVSLEEDAMKLKRRLPQTSNLVHSARRYTRYRVHQSLAMNAPEGRKVWALGEDNVIAIPHVGELQHRYERRAA